MNKLKETIRPKYAGFFYYTCPIDDTYSGNMKLVRINKTYNTEEYIKLTRRNILHVAKERLKCPKCKKTYGWHQLKRNKGGEK